MKEEFVPHLLPPYLTHSSIFNGEEATLNNLDLCWGIEKKGKKKKKRGEEEKERKGVEWSLKQANKLKMEEWIYPRLEKGTNSTEE